MIRKIFTSSFMIMLLCVPLLAADSKAGGQNIDTLSWEIIAEKFDSKELFCAAKSKDKKTINFALTPDALTITLPSNIKISEEQTETELNLSVWQQDQWADLPPLTAQIEPNNLTVESNAITDGFYKLSLVFNKNDVGKENDCYAVVAVDWKRDFFAWCLKNKEHIETNPDPQLIYSSIAVSHFDNLMELAGKSQTLSENILSALSKAIKANLDFKDCNCPDLVIALNKIRLKRFEGGSIEEFAIFIPETYNKSNPEAVFLHPNKRRGAAINNYASHSGLIDIWWHTVNDKDINWKNFEYFFNTLKQKLNIDENRVYVNGECDNGLAAMSLALNFPDQWAECSMSLGNTYRHMAGNALNLPLIFVKGWHNEDWAIGYYDFAVECFKYYGCRFFKHSKFLSTTQVRGGSVPTETRDLSPYRVSYTIESLANPSAYWLQIDGREDENFIASIDAIVWGQSILVRTDNVDAYTLNLELALPDCNRSVEIIENGQSLGFATGQVYTKRVEKYIDVTHIKNERLHGPVWDGFTDPYVVVWGTHSNDKQFCITSEETARSLANGGPCFADINMPEELVDEHNLILVGTKESNVWLSKIYKELPLQVKEGLLPTNGKSWEGRNIGFILIYPNPLNPERYAAVFSATSTPAMAEIPEAYLQMQSLNPADVGIFEIVKENKVKWHILEKFNSVWSWHDEWERVLAETKKKHPKWKWHQWAAQIIKEQLNADIVICEDIFKFENSVVVGQLTYRDLFNSFKNDWIVKIILDGKSLKDLLVVPFSDISRREVAAPVICGVNFLKPEGGCEERALVVNELENDKKYTVALPYNVLNGARMGAVLQNYKIVGEDYLVSLLKESLCKNKNLDIDAELDNIRLNIF